MNFRESKERLPSTRAEVSHEVESLSVLWRLRDAADPEWRDRTAGRLKMLRELWRQQPELFGPPDIEKLREIGAGLAAAFADERPGGCNAGGRHPRHVP